MIKKKPAILVTGSSGMVGYHLVQALLKKDYKVIGIDPKPYVKKLKNYTHFNDINININEFLTLFNKYNIVKVVHAGGISGPMLYNNKPYKVIDNNVFFTIKLVEACRIYKKINRIIYCSSIAAYGNLIKRNSTEQLKFAPNTIYGASKASSDLMLENFYNIYGLDIISLRFSVIYGPKRKTNSYIKDMINAAINHEKLFLPFKPNLCWPYIYIDDVISAIIKSLLHKKSHTFSYNVTGPDFPTYKRIFEIIKSFYNDFEVVFSKENSFSKLELFNIKKIKNDIEWKPSIDIEKGITKYVKFYKN
jgi:UDP-glucuronate 4-epimerase